MKKRRKRGIKNITISRVMRGKMKEENEKAEEEKEEAEEGRRRNGRRKRRKKKRGYSGCSHNIRGRA